MNHSFILTNNKYFVVITDDNEDLKYPIVYEHNEWIVRIYGGWFTQYYKDHCQAHINYLVSNNIAFFKFQENDIYKKDYILVLNQHVLLEII
jgi:hypothetical protein